MTSPFLLRIGNWWRHSPASVRISMSNLRESPKSILMTRLKVYDLQMNPPWWLRIWKVTLTTRTISKWVTLLKLTEHIYHTWILWSKGVVPKNFRCVVGRVYGIPMYTLVFPNSPSTVPEEVFECLNLLKAFSGGVYGSTLKRYLEDKGKEPL